MLGAGITVGLEEDQQAVELAAASSFERGFDLGRMMAVIINDGDVVDRALDVEAAADATEFGEAFADQLGGNVEVKSDGGSGGGIANVVDARRMWQTEDAQIFFSVSQAELAGQALELNVADDQVRLARSAVGQNGALHVRNDGLNVWFVDAKDCSAIKGDAIDKLSEGILNIGERGILVKVFTVNGGDDGHDRGKKQEAAVAFVGFNDEVFAAAQARGGAGLIDAAADDKRGIEM